MKIDKAKQFHESFAKKTEECREKKFREPNSTDYGMGYGDGYNDAMKTSEWIHIERQTDLPIEEGEYLGRKIETLASTAFNYEAQFEVFDINKYSDKWLLAQKYKAWSHIRPYTKPKK